jgi:hypothetical protein
LTVTTVPPVPSASPDKIRFASAGLVALLLYLYPTFVTILSVIFLKSKITLVKMAALETVRAPARVSLMIFLPLNGRELKAQQ